MRLEHLDLRAQSCGFGSVEHRHLRAAPLQQHSCRRAAFAGAEDGHGLAEMRWMAQRFHRSLSVASPSRANITDMIQKRTMTVFSFHPLSSK